MLKKALLLSAITSLLTAGCTTTALSDNDTNTLQRVVVMQPSSVPLTKISPAATFTPKQRALVFACIDLAKPDLVRPDTISPNLSKTKVTTDTKGVTTVKMPFSALNVNNVGKDYFKQATCEFTKSGKGTIYIKGI